MSTETIMGIITFINHDKDYATIEYTINGKKKTISGNIGEREQLKLKAEKAILLLISKRLTAFVS